MHTAYSGAVRRAIELVADPDPAIGMDGWRWVALFPALGAIFGLVDSAGSSGIASVVANRGRVSEAERVVEKLEPMPNPSLDIDYQNRNQLRRRRPAALTLSEISAHRSPVVRPCCSC